jgi:predicted acyltransferase (DUF342 family)
MIILDAKASNFDLQSVKDRFAQNPVYVALPQESHMFLQILLRHAQQAGNLEDAKAILGKALEVAEWAWPIGVPQKMTEITHEGIRVRHPRQ